MQNLTKGYNVAEAVQVLRNTPAVIENLLTYLDDDWVLSKESPDSWSPKEIVAHLIHGELTDWIPRTKIILANEGQSLVPFEMEGHLPYLESSLYDLLNRFKTLRAENLSALVDLEISDADLDRTAKHPALGTVTLRNHLAAWVVHDLGHIAQISRVMAKQYKSEVGPWTDFMAILHDRQTPSNNS